MSALLKISEGVIPFMYSSIAISLKLSLNVIDLSETLSICGFILNISCCCNVKRISEIIIVPPNNRFL